MKQGHTSHCLPPVKFKNWNFKMSTPVKKSSVVLDWCCPTAGVPDYIPSSLALPMIWITTGTTSRAEWGTTSVLFISNRIWQGIASTPASVQNEDSSHSTDQRYWKAKIENNRFWHIVRHFSKYHVTLNYFLASGQLVTRSFNKLL